MASPVGAWWAQFGDQILEDLIGDALASNLDLRVAMGRVAESRALLAERRLDQLPRIIAEGGYDRRNQQQAVISGQRALTETYSLGFDASWEIDFFGRQRRATEAARATMEATQASLEDVQVTVAAEVARNYFELRGVQRRLEVARTTLVNLEETQKMVQTRWSLGAGSELDVQSSRARLKGIEAEIPLLEISETQYRYRLAVLLGKRPGTIDMRLTPRPSSPYVHPLLLGDVSELLRRRPDIRVAERQLAAASARVGIATADLFPRVNLSGFIGFLSGNPAAFLGSASRAWAVTPTISWSAFDLGSVRARLRATQAQGDIALVYYEKAVLSALEETQNALDSFGQQQARLVIVAEQASAARRAEELAQVRFREGSEDFLTLLDAQRTRLAADDALAQSEATVNVNVVAVYKALGGNRQASAGEGLSPAL